MKLTQSFALNINLLYVVEYVIYYAQAPIILNYLLLPAIIELKIKRSNELNTFR